MEDSLSSTLNSRIPAAGGRVTAVARDAERHAQAFPLDSQQRSAVSVGAILHDIGMWTSPLGVRIIAVVDAFHAMTSPRAYRPARSMEYALQELQNCSGTQFDSRVVDEFVHLVREGQ